MNLHRKKAGQVVVIVSILLSALVLTLHLPQRAAAVMDDDISVTPSSAPRGATIEVTGTTYSNCPVNYLIFSQDPKHRRWPATLTPGADYQWDFAGSMTVPADAPISRYPLNLTQGNYPIEFHQESAEGASSCRDARGGVFNVINRAPKAAPFSLTTRINTAVSENLAGHVSDPDGADGFLESYQVSAPPGHGVATVSGAKLSYVPNKGFSGSDALKYRVCEADGSEGGACSQPETVAIKVTASTVSVVVTVAPLSSCVDHQAGVVASATQDGTPLPGVAVTFEMRMPGQPNLTRIGGMTGQDGRATVSYSRPVAGNDSITAHVSVPGALPDPATSPPVVAHWLDCAVSVTLAPAGTHTPAGNDVTVTATVRYLGNPAHGAAVTLTGTMPGQPTKDRSGTTDENGLVSFVLHRDSPGLETLTAVAHFAGGQGTAVTTHVWDPVVGPPGLAIDLGPAGTASTVGETFVATATVTDGKQHPLEGVTVTFTATMPGAPTQTRHPVTDGAGHASLSWSRESAGTDTITATAVLGPDRRGQATIVHVWRPTSSGPRRPDQTLTAEDPNPVGGAGNAAIGRGCPGQTPVALRLDSIALATGTADEQGRFHIPFRAPTLPLGRHLLTATCGPTVLTTPLDYVINQSSNATTKAAVTTTAAVLTLFVLLGLQILRPGLGSHPTP